MESFLINNDLSIESTRAMGKIYDALEKSCQDEKKSSKDVSGFQNHHNKKIVRLNQNKDGAISNEIDKKIITFHDPRSVEAESFKFLRTNIIFPNNGKKIKTLMITSANQGEGKSFVSANLAASIAHGIDHYALLIDCDVRKPTIHSLFGYDETTGLSEYLNSNVSVENIIRKTALQKLSIITSGKPPKNPTELLTSRKMNDLIEEVKDRYQDRYIIIDTPPPTMTAETKALAKIVDGIVLVIRSGKTNKNIVNDLLGDIGKDKIIGVVLNRYDAPFSKYKMYGYNSYGKYYGKNE